MDLAARGRLSCILLHLKFLDAFNNLHSVEAHFNTEIVLQIHLSDVVDDLTVDSDLL